MPSLIVCRLFFFIFFGSLALIRRANSDENGGFGKTFPLRDEDRKFNTLRQLFPMEDSSVDAMKSLIYDGNIEKVVNILQNNVKQWSFIESQLLEPNVNVGMPEIFIPLKHLTTTLELLGNVFISRNEYTEAKGCLERACPLMELLPADVLENDGRDDLQAVLSSTRSANSSPSKNKKATNSASKTNSNNKPAEQNPYAASCFALLRDVYNNLYEKGGAMASQVVEQFDRVLYSEPKPSVVFVPVDHQINKKMSTSSAVLMTTDGMDPAKRPEKLQSLRMGSPHSVSNLVQAMRKVDQAVARATATSSAAAAVTEGSSDPPPHSGSGRGHRERYIEQLNRDWITRRIEELRGPYDHLRASTTTNTAASAAVTGTAKGAAADQEGPAGQDLDALRLLMKQTTAGGAGAGGGSLHHSFILKGKQQQQQPQPHASGGSREEDDTAASEDSLSDRTIRSILFGRDTDDDESEEQADASSSGSASGGRVSTNTDKPSAVSSPSAGSSAKGSASKKASSAKPVSSTSGSSSTTSSTTNNNNVAVTSLIASDLEDMLRKFSSGDRSARAGVIKRARHYYDNLDIQYPEMAYAEYSANMDLGMLFIEMMVSVMQEGSGYIGQQLLQWSETNGGIREVDQDFFDSILVADRNKLLVLSAFDVALSSGGDSDDSLMDIFNIFDIATASAATSLLAPSDLLQRAGQQQQQQQSAGKKSSSGSSGSKKEGKNKKKSRKSSSSGGTTGSGSTSVGTSAAASGGGSSVSNEEASSSSGSGSTASPAASLNRLEREVTAALYEEFLGSNVDVAALRSSVPMLNADSDWTLIIFYLVVVVSVVIVMQLLYADAQRKNKSRGGRGSGRGGGSGSGGGSQRRPVFGIAVLDQLFYALQPPEESGGDAGEGPDTPHSSGSSSSSSSVNPTTAAAADALTTVFSLLLLVYRLALWLLSALLQLLLRLLSAALRSVSPPAAPTTAAAAAPVSSSLKGKSSPRATAEQQQQQHPQASLQGLVDLIKQQQQQVGSDSHHPAPSEDTSTASKTHSSSSSAAAAAAASRLSAEAALDNELAATFASEMASSSSAKNSKKQISFSNNLIAPSVHVAAKNGVPITVKKNSALKQPHQQQPSSSSGANGKSTNLSSDDSNSNSSSSGNGHTRPSSTAASSGEKDLVYVSKIAGKTIPMKPLAGVSSVAAAGDGEEGQDPGGDFIPVNTNRDKKRDRPARGGAGGGGGASAASAAVIALPAAFNGIKLPPNHATGYSTSSTASAASAASRRTAVVDHTSTGSAGGHLPYSGGAATAGSAVSASGEERKASSLPNTPLHSSGHGGFFADPSPATAAGIRGVNSSNSSNSSGIASTGAAASLPPPPPLRTASKVKSPDIKGLTASPASLNNLHSAASVTSSKTSPPPAAHSLSLLPPAKTTSALQSLDYSLLSSASYLHFDSSNSSGVASDGFGFDSSASELVDFSSSVFSSSSRAFVAPPPGMTSSLFGPSTTTSAVSASGSRSFDQWTSSASTSAASKPSTAATGVGAVAPSLFLDDFEFDDGVLQAADAFLEGLDYATSPLPPRVSTNTVAPAAPSSAAITASSSSVTAGIGGSVFSSNTATAMQTLTATPPRKKSSSSGVASGGSSSVVDSSITIEAMYDGLSPDAPSFQPGKMYTTSRLTSSGAAASSSSETSRGYSSYVSISKTTTATATAGSVLGSDLSAFGGLHHQSKWEDKLAEDLFDNLLSDLDGVMEDPAEN